MEPTVGLHFLHARVMDANRNPQEYVVTKVARGTAYYRPVDGGSPDCCDVENFPRYARPLQ